MECLSNKHIRLTLQPAILNLKGAYELQGRHQATHTPQSGHLPEAWGRWRRPALSGEAAQGISSGSWKLDAKASRTRSASILQHGEPDEHVEDALCQG